MAEKLFSLKLNKFEYKLMTDLFERGKDFIAIEGVMFVTKEQGMDLAHELKAHSAELWRTGLDSKVGEADMSYKLGKDIELEVLGYTTF